MTSDWFCKISGEKYGPLSAERLKTMAAKGELSTDDWVKQGEDGSWVEASTVKGLFSDDKPKTPPPMPSAPAGDKSAQATKLPVARAAPIPPADTGQPAQTDSTPPVARPVQAAATPVAAQPVPAAKPAAAPARPAPVQAAPVQAAPAAKPGPIVVTTDSPASSGHSSSPEPYDPAAIRARKKKQQTKVVVGLVIGIIGIAVAGIVASQIDFSSKDPVAEKPDKNAPSAEDEPDIGSEEPDVSTDESGKEPGEKPKTPVDEPAPEVPKDTPDDEWVDASKGVFHLSPLSVKVLSVKKGRPSYEKTDDEGAVTIKSWPSTCLMIALELKRTANMGVIPVKHKSWSSRGSGASLTSDKDEQCAKKVFKPGGPTPIGYSEELVLSGEDPATDMVLFAPPSKEFDKLRLLLPGKAFGRKGDVRFEIPKEMIETIAPPPEETPDETPAPPDGGEDPFEEFGDDNAPKDGPDVIELVPEPVDPDDDGERSIFDDYPGLRPKERD